FVAASIAWAVLLPLAPFVASQPAPARFWYGLAFVVYGAGSFICHQLPARSFHSWSAQWPVCARCTGIYVGAAVTAIVATVRFNTVRLPSLSLRPGKPDTTYLHLTNPRRARAWLAAAALPTAVTLAYEWTTGDMPSNAIRAFAGAPLGAAVAFIVVGALPVQSAAGPYQVRPNVN
ncbi:MAG: DUF2085 domain-containing protein, partial [Vicinamibacterales bacterium]|nr:DUF2085 domain-containing protein [Vicinamibacterales bacterium]